MMALCSHIKGVSGSLKVKVHESYDWSLRTGQDIMDKVRRSERGNQYF